MPEMSLVTGIIVTLLLFLLLVGGMPIAFSMMFAGTLGLTLLTGPETAFSTLARAVYETATHYPYTIIPLFVLMGSLASAGGITEELYTTFHKWLRTLPGGLAIATIFACGGFAAISGSSVAATAAMGRIAYPEMKRLGYDDVISSGAIAAGGTLSFLIPPSLGFVVYGMLTEQSIGKLLIAGVLPGILLTVIYAAEVMALSVKRGVVFSKVEAVPLVEKIAALKGIIETLLIFLIVMGGIYFGIVTPSEAGAIGAAAVFIVVLAKRKLSKKGLSRSLEEMLRVSTFVLFIVAGANVFSYFLALCNIPMMVATAISNLHVSKYVILSIILAIYLLLGCFLDAISMMVLTLPVLFPVITSLGFNPIWFGVVCVMMMEAGLLTPPVGLNVYTLAGVINVPVNVIFRGSAPFLLAIFAIVVLLCLFPEVALWLPSLMVGG